jgi:hypothetical protein
MPSAIFHADAASLANWLKHVYAQTDCIVYETYSGFGAELRVFPSPSALLAACPIDSPSHSLNTYQLSLWSRTVMPEPHVKRIDLKVKDHSFRFSVQGCGLYSLLIGAANSEDIRKCELSYWSEAGANQRCSVEPGPSTVDWVSHKRLGASLVRQAKRLSNAL